jgi:hypothetical protein
MVVLSKMVPTIPMFSSISTDFLAVLLKRLSSQRNFSKKAIYAASPLTDPA